MNKLKCLSIDTTMQQKHHCSSVNLRRDYVCLVKYDKTWNDTCTLKRGRTQT